MPDLGLLLLGFVLPVQLTHNCNVEIAIAKVTIYFGKNKIIRKKTIINIKISHILANYFVFCRKKMYLCIQIASNKEKQKHL